MNNANSSLLLWLAQSVGSVGLALLLIVTMISFGLAILVISRGKSRSSGIALLAIVPMPLFAGLFLPMNGIINAATTISLSTTPVKSTEIAEGFTVMLATPLAGALFTLPVYL